MPKIREIDSDEKNVRRCCVPFLAAAGFAFGVAFSTGDYYAAQSMLVRQGGGSTHQRLSLSPP